MYNPLTAAEKRLFLCHIKKYMAKTKVLQNDLEDFSRFQAEKVRRYLPFSYENFGHNLAAINLELYWK